MRAGLSALGHLTSPLLVRVQLAHCEGVCVLNLTSDYESRCFTENMHVLLRVGGSREGTKSACFWSIGACGDFILIWPSLTGAILKIPISVSFTMLSLVLRAAHPH